VVLAPKARGEVRERRLERLEAAGVERGEGFWSLDDAYPCPFLWARLGQQNRPMLEIQGEKTDLLWNGNEGGPPLQSSRDHQMKNEGYSPF